MKQPSLNIVITGASRGIGSALAAAVGDNHRLVLLGRDQRALTNVAQGLKCENCATIVCDMLSNESIAQACSAFGQVDVLINNAGIAEFGDAVAMPYELAQRQITTNLLGPIAMMNHVVPGMVERSHGMIISINSVAATTVFRGAAAYSASKAGLLAYTRSLRQDVRDHGIKVVDIIVGATETEIWNPESRQTHGHRMMTAYQVADVVRQIIDRYHDGRMMIEEITIRPQLGDL